MRKLLALLFLLVTPAAYAQVDFTDAVNVPNIVVNPTMDNCVSGPSACGAWMESGSTIGNWVSTNSNGGAVAQGKQYTFSYMQGTLYQNIDLSQYATNAFNFTFTFDLNNSCRNFIGGACDRVDGPIDQFSAVVKFYDTNGLNNSFTFLSGTPSTATVGCVGGLEVLGLCLLGENVQDAWQSFGWYSSVQSNALFTSAQIEFTGKDAGFWGGLYGPSVDTVGLQINYLPSPYPVSGGGSGMNVAAPGSDYIFIYKGNDPILFSQLAIKGQDLVGWTAVSGSDALTVTSVTRPDPDYLFIYTDGVPVNGSWYSFQEQAPGADCTIYPSDPQCAILVYTDPALIADNLIDSVVADASTSMTDQTTEEPAPEDEEVLVAEEPTNLVDLEKQLAEDKDDEEIVVAATDTPEASTITYVSRELTDEEKAAILADAIAKNTLESALSIANNAAVAGSSAGTTESTSSGTTSRKDTGSDMSADTNTNMIAENTQSNQAETQDTTGALDILETGRVKGQEALAVTLAGAENSANDSMNQAESIASNSSVASYTVNNVDENIAATNSSMTGLEENKTAAEMSMIESVAAAEAITQAAIESSKIASQSAFDDGTNTDAEAVVAMLDPNLAAANAYNANPNVMNLEILGVIKAPVEEKSDAEKRAEEVVAANQQQMEEINKNYMDADQSGIVAAIGADVDVSSYRNARLLDAAAWYKPEDIYKGVIIKDNVRGSYFLEKGNTDTFRKMVDEQYK